ncbi:MAG: metal-dependent hydrolase [Gemmataceae bacterium]
MASYRGHLTLAAPLGAAYGALALYRPEPDWGVAILAAALTTVGGLMPDLDSDSGVPVRELFGMIAALAAVFLFHPLREAQFSIEQTLALLVVSYFFVRYVVANGFRAVTVHRGMFHSVPAMLISGLIVYLAYPSPDFRLRLYFGGAMTFGFLSHLVLDEIYAVDFNGLRLKTNQFAGTALKFGSASWSATLLTYLILLGLGYVTFNDVPPWVRNPAEWLASLHAVAGR